MDVLYVVIKEHLTPSGFGTHYNVNKVEFLDAYVKEDEALAYVKEANAKGTPFCNYYIKRLNVKH